MKPTASPAAAGRPSPLPEEVAFLELQRTADILSRGVADLLKSEELSAAQYNVLRILRGAAQPLPCGEIAGRMITRDPDITRLLDRLEKRGLIARCRDTLDRRVVMASITLKGARLLARMDEPVRDAHRRQLGHMGDRQLRALIRLLEAARANAA
jgi:DNA-binding MarR family transcriptional regulator